MAVQIDSPHVAIMVQTASSWSRSVLEGVSEYISSHRPWQVFLEPRGFYETPRLPRGWQGDGVLARVSSPSLGRALRRLGKPTVNVSWLGQHSHAIPKVVSDEKACGELAARHFMERGFRSFAYVGPLEQLGYGSLLADSFTACLRSVGFDPAMFLPGGRPVSVTLFEERRRLKSWLETLKKPVGVVTWSSETANQAVHLCREIGVAVPEEVAVLAVEHDELFSNFAPVALSYIDQQPRLVGYRAAALLDRMMQGRKPPTKPQLIAPSGVVQHRSTEAYAVSDLKLQKALRVLQDHTHTPITIDVLARKSGMSRRSLEQRFRKNLGKTPASELRRLRIEEAKRLLVQGNTPLDKIASQCGFEHVEVFIRNFRAVEGMPPGAWRQQKR